MSLLLILQDITLKTFQNHQIIAVIILKIFQMLPGIYVHKKLTMKKN